MSRVIGIDLGTTNSCVAVLEGDQPTVIPNSEGGRTTPSIVAITKNGERLVGEAARRQMTVNVDRTITSIKRAMGTTYRKRIDGKDYSPQEISAIILAKLKSDAESYLGGPVSDAVITVPAYFDDSQRQATKDAGRIAGLNVLRIINEPTSAALAYGLDNGQAQKILVYDLGGGTFDVSVIEIGDSVIEVLATAGDNHLGGDDFDERLQDYVIKTFKKETKVNLAKDITASQRVREACENAKKELSFAQTAHINLPFISTVKNQPVHLDMTITREQFNELTYDLVERTAGPVNQALSDAGITRNQIDKVLLVGGSTRIPAVVDKVRAITGREPSKNMNPDECVAMGAAVQGSKLSGELTVSNKVNDILLMDVTPLSLSIETLGGVANVIIPRNSAIPTRASKIFTTAGNFQRDVEIKVYQGERHFTRDNKLLGNFRLSGIKRAMAGVPQIEVTFDMDQAPKWLAKLETAIMMPMFYPFITGKESGILKKVFEKKMNEGNDSSEYMKKFMEIMGKGSGIDFSFISKESMKNQFCTDLYTSVGEHINVPGTTIHVFYAKKMGEKYLERYRKCFADPDICEFDLQHEELLLDADRWVHEVCRVCGINHTL